jgi:hypothetical protein
MAMCVALLVACYQPASEAPCSVRCSMGVCPSGMTCGGDGLCRSSPTDNCSTINNDGGGDLDGATFCFGNGFVRNICVAPPELPRTYSNVTISTTTDNCSFMRDQSDGTTLCFFVYSSIVFDGRVRVIGPNPAVFVGSTQVIVQAGATIDVSSKGADVIPGAGGGNAVGCTPALSLAGEGDGNMIVGSGGAGGSFTGFGGPGGDGVYMTSSLEVTIGGGSSGSLIGVSTVRGGCSGGHGGKGAAAGVFPRGGFGGGAVYLVSGGAVRVYGTINASGAGGDAPSVGGGGGGGGTGGFIGLDAPAYDLQNCQIFAVGGSGASGATADLSGTGQPGKEATMPMTAGTTLAPSGAGIGGAGGDFAAGANGGAAIAGGGGGGGGSRGFIGIAGPVPVPLPPTASFAPVPELME